MSIECAFSRTGNLGLAATILTYDFSLVRPLHAQDDVTTQNGSSALDRKRIGPLTLSKEECQVAKRA